MPFVPSLQHQAGEHRLPACSFRQLAEKLFVVITIGSQRCRRQAADDCRLAACAPQKKSRMHESCRSARSPIALFRRMTTSTERPSDFIRDIVAEHLRTGKYELECITLRVFDSSLSRAWRLLFCNHRRFRSGDREPECAFLIVLMQPVVQIQLQLLERGVKTLLRNLVRLNLHGFVAASL